MFAMKNQEELLNRFFCLLQDLVLSRLNIVIGDQIHQYVDFSDFYLALKSMKSVYAYFKGSQGHCNKI